MPFPSPGSPAPYRQQITKFGTTLRSAIVPPEGDIQIPGFVNWGTDAGGATSIAVNLQGTDPASITRIGALFVNNIYSTVDAVFLFADSQFPLTVPAGTQGLYPVVTNRVDFVIMAPGAAVGDSTYFNVFNFLPPPVTVEKPTFTSIAGLAGIAFGAASTPLVGAGINGLITAAKIFQTGSLGGGAAGNDSITLQDGNGTSIAFGGISWNTATYVPPCSLIDFEAAQVRFVNGLNLLQALTGTAPAALGAIAANIYFRSGTTP